MSTEEKAYPRSGGPNPRRSHARASVRHGKRRSADERKASSQLPISWWALG